MQSSWQRTGGRKTEIRKEPGVTSLWHGLGSRGFYTPYSVSMWVEKETETLYPLSLASSPASTSKRQVAKALRKPTQLLSYVPTLTHTQTRIQQLGAHTHTHFSTTDFDVTNGEHIFPSDTHTQTRAHACMRLYFVHRDIRINRFVKLGLSSHIHRNHGIRCINAFCSWICIRQWCATRTEDYFWQTLSLSLLCSLTHRRGHNSSHPHTDTHIYIYMYAPKLSHRTHASVELHGLRRSTKCYGIWGLSTSNKGMQI